VAIILIIFKRITDQISCSLNRKANRDQNFPPPGSWVKTQNIQVVENITDMSICTITELDVLKSEKAENMSCEAIYFKLAI